MRFPNKAMPCKAIWLNNESNRDEYADFFPDVSFNYSGKYILRIVCDTDRAIYLDGELISFGHYADYPGTPVYEDIAFEPKRNSKLKITVWHSGIDSQTHVATDAYVAFCIYKDGNVVYSSSCETLVRPTPEYTPYLCKIITPQMGAGFSLKHNLGSTALTKSVERDIEIDTLRPRPIKHLYLDTAKHPNILRTGLYYYKESGDSALMMKSAVIDCDSGLAAGRYFLLDIGEECVGFPEIDYYTEKGGYVRIGWGEHITDGMCRSAIGIRRFTFDIDSAKGSNHFFPALRRIGARYIQIFIDDINAELKSFIFHPVMLPVTIIEQKFEGEKAPLRSRIRNTAIHTLRCCMHEHYEDCPWREQALYTLDSRNQMLAGYKVFEDKNSNYVRANLDLISRGVREDGILALCYPAGLDYPIPFYTLAYFMQMKEYIDNTGDTTLALEKYDTLVSLLNVFYARCDQRGLVARFPDSEGYWNFYEWSKNLSGDKIHRNTPVNDLPYEANLNAALAITSRSMADICKAVGEDTDASFYANKADIISASIAQTFYDSKTEMFYDFTDRPSLQPSVLTQAMCLLSGAADNFPKSKMLTAIAQNGGNYNGVEIIPATLSMACFRYEALLRSDKDKYKNVILNEIDRDGKYMLQSGATTFWETLKGEADFGGAGSLCHGWSAMAAYYYSTIL